MCDRTDSSGKFFTRRKQMRFTYDDLKDRYSDMTSSVIVNCEVATPLVGGLTASDAGIKMFVQHHLGIKDPVEAEATFKRIKSEELGDKPVPSETGELNERLTYGINVIRRTEKGPYLGNWMIHANLKTAMSRIDLFSSLRGTKGNVTEGGIVYPAGISKRDDRPDCIYLMGPDGKTPAKTYFDEFKGRVQSPRGSVSVMHHSECVPAGTRFSYEFKFIRGKMTEDDIRDFLALSMIVGIGSVKSLGNGKFRIVDAEIKAASAERKKKAKEEKANKEDDDQTAAA